MRQLFRALLLLLFLTGSLACRQDRPQRIATAPDYNSQERPLWLTNLIRKQKEHPAANPPAKIYQYRYQRQPVYYLTSRCCDQPGQLYDNQGQLICEPDGGITGQGDGRCPDFFVNRTDETLIWEDKR